MQKEYFATFKITSGENAGVITFSCFSSKEDFDKKTSEMGEGIELLEEGISYERCIELVLSNAPNNDLLRDIIFDHCEHHNT